MFFPLLVLAVLCGVLGNGVVAWTLCLHVRAVPTHLLPAAGRWPRPEPWLLRVHRAVENPGVVAPRDMARSRSLEGVSGFCDMVGLCLLATMTTQSFLVPPVRSWGCCRQLGTSVAQSTLSWAPALCVHPGTEVCADLETDPPM